MDKKNQQLTKTDRGNTAVSLVLFDKKFLDPSLTGPEKDLILATNGRKIKDLTTEDVMTAINSSLNTGVVILGHRNQYVNKKELIKDIAIISHNVCKKYYDYTINDIQDAISEGCHGEYEEKPFLNPSSVNIWIKKHIIRKSEALKKQFTFQNRTQKGLDMNKPEPPSPDQIKEDMLVWALKAFEEYKVNGSYIDWGNTVYDFLNELNFISVTIERKKEIWKKIGSDMLTKAKRQVSFTQQEKNDKEKEILVIENSIKNKEGIVVFEAKRNTLDVFFKDLIVNKIELRSLLKDHIDEILAKKEKNKKDHDKKANSIKDSEGQKDCS